MYLLDTNICVHIIRNKPEYVREKIKMFNPALLHLSVITVAELEYGAAKSSCPQRERQAVLDFISPFNIVDFNPKDAENFGLIRSFLERKGKAIGSYDLLIAAQALSRDFTVVTNNVREFERVPNLAVENWIER